MRPRHSRRTFALAFLGAALLSLSPSPASAASESETPPNFRLTTVDGKPVQLSDFKGKVVYLDFWASWCGPCKHTLPWMQRLQQRYRADGLEVVAVNLDPSPADAQPLLTSVRPTFTVLYDPAGSAASDYQVPTMPTSFLIGRDGRIAAVHSGFADEDESVIEREVARLVGSKPTTARASLVHP